MSIVTRKMQYNREVNKARESDNCAVWFPCTDGSGNTLTDVVNNVVITDSGPSATHNEPHAVSFAHSPGAVTSGIFPVLKENLLLVLCQKVVTLESFVAVKIGTNTNVSVTNGVASCDYGLGATNGATTATSALGSAAGNTLTTASAVIGDNIYHYGSINNAGISQNTTADASGFTAAFSSGNPTIEATITLSSIAARQHIYGVALFTFAKNTFNTGQIITALDYIDDNWAIGKKYMPSGLL